MPLLPCSKQEEELPGSSSLGRGPLIVDSESCQCCCHLCRCLCSGRALSLFHPQLSILSLLLRVAAFETGFL